MGIDSISPLLGNLVDELDRAGPGSTDDTERAVAAGIRSSSVARTALPEVPQPGKGEVLWRCLAATTGDIIAFVDSDLIDPDPMFVPKLARPAAHHGRNSPGQRFLPAPAEGGRRRDTQRRRPRSPSWWRGRLLAR